MVARIGGCRLRAGGNERLSYTGVYINLDRDTARRAAMEAQIVRHRLHGCYRRFPGADGNILDVPSLLSGHEIGRLTSHYLVLKAHLDHPAHLHVVEDDVLFSAMMNPTIRSMVTSPLIEDYDILFLDTVLDPFGPHGLRFLREAKKILEDCVVRDANGNAVRANLVPVEYAAASTSYLINRGSTRKLASVYDEALAGGAKQPLDLLIRRKGEEGSLRVGCAFPFLTSVRLDEIAATMAQAEGTALRRVVLNLLRHVFFVERDIDRLIECADRLLPPPSPDLHRGTIERLLEFFLTRDFHTL
jgi:hypothetical protein